MTDEAVAAGAPPAMPLLYKRPTPVTLERHKDLKIRQKRNYSYAASAHAVPAVLDEIPLLSGHYPLVFTPGDNPALVALLGLRPEESLVVNKDGSFEPGWPIPAYLTRYPFMLVPVPQDDRMILVMEEDSNVVAQDGDHPLFENGQGSKHGQEVMNYCMAFNRSVEQTQAFCKELNDRGLLIDQRADLMTPDRKQIALSGFRIVDEQKLNELPDEVFIAWRRKNWVGIIYAHLLSLSRWNNLLRLAGERVAAND
ncbi:SapC family protein [Indioceanicola profundi]|uniref:SapC family protein n=1 Tax=Indioceanicola profundi TaxID=2220096 RepID=UPI000E6A9ADA|nr:SapC family protein [Indioceanicola profundi]